ncbi:MAG: hypothetical protein IJ960_00750 [Oscillospiraceae bacterium]|nr:hypothetical protein [Oscillospiraceae bacterium]
MAKPTNVRDLPRSQNAIDDAAREVLDAIRPAGWPIRTVEAVLRRAITLLQDEPVRFPSPHYQSYVEE